jgi:DNA-directed RNA polymerase subunit K
MKEYTRFEKARIIGARALQIARGAPPTIKTDIKEIIDPIKIAELEFEEGVCPLDTKRPENCVLKK